MNAYVLTRLNDEDVRLAATTFHGALSEVRKLDAPGPGVLVQFGTTESCFYVWANGDISLGAFGTRDRVKWALKRAKAVL